MSTTAERYEELAEQFELAHKLQMYVPASVRMDAAAALREAAEMKRAVERTLVALDREIATSGLFARQALRNVRRELCEAAEKSGTTS